MQAQDTNAKGGCHQGRRPNRQLMTAKCHEAHNRKQNKRVRWGLTPARLPGCPATLQSRKLWYAVQWSQLRQPWGRRHKYSIRVDYNRTWTRLAKGEQLSSSIISVMIIARPAHPQSEHICQLSSARTICQLSHGPIRCQFNRTPLDCKAETNPLIASWHKQFSTERWLQTATKLN